MGSKENINAGDARFQGLLERYLLLRARSESPNDTALHLDEDTLTAFTEGNLTYRESDAAAGHLADCSFCRHKTAELVRLEMAISDADISTIPVESSEPSRVSEFLGGILARLFGGGEAAVFAHEEKSDEERKKNEEDGEGDKLND